MTEPEREPMTAPDAATANDGTSAAYKKAPDGDMDLVAAGLWTVTDDGFRVQAWSPGQEGPRERTPFDQIRRALGSRVLVTLDYDDPKAVLKGTLRSISEDGEVCVVGEDGVAVYGWPCLIVTVIPDA